MGFIHVALTVHLVACERSLAHLYCGKIAFFPFFAFMEDVVNISIITFSLHLDTNLNIWLWLPASQLHFCPLCIANFPSSFCQMKGRSYLSTVPTMDVVTGPHALTYGLPLRLKTSTAQTPLAELLTGTVARFFLNMRNKTRFQEPVCYWHRWKGELEFLQGSLSQLGRT